MAWHIYPLYYRVASIFTDVVQLLHGCVPGRDLLRHWDIEDTYTAVLEKAGVLDSCKTKKSAVVSARSLQSSVASAGRHKIFGCCQERGGLS